MLPTIKFNLSDVPCVYSETRTPNTYDIIAFVRAQYPNPRTAVVLSCDNVEKLDLISLNRQCIYVDGQKEEDLNTLGGLIEDACLVIDYSMLKPEEEDCGLIEIVSDLSSKYELTDTNLLFVGPVNEETLEVYKRLRVILNEQFTSQKYRFPKGTQQSILRSPNSLILDDIADILNNRPAHTLLDYKLLSKGLNEIQRLYTDKECPKRHVQINNGVPSLLLRKLYVGTIMKFQAFPRHRPQAYNTDSYAFQYLYPVGKLSLYERLMFVRRLPRSLGYVTPGSATCVCFKFVTPLYEMEVDSTGDDESIYKPIVIYDWETCEEVFDVPFHPFKTLACNEATTLYDPRNFFENSGYTERKGEPLTNGSQIWDNPDYQISRKIVEKFRKMSVKRPISFKNAVPFYYNDHMYLAYMPYQLMLGGSIISNITGGYSALDLDPDRKKLATSFSPLDAYEGGITITIPEKEFNRLTDVRIPLSYWAAEAVNNVRMYHATAEQFFYRYSNKLAVTPAIPVDLAMIVDLTQTSNCGLSMYDRMLRCMPNVLPVSFDERGDYPNCILNEISLETLSNGLLSQNYINCCGTLTSFDPEPSLPITYKELKGRRLLQ